jgi:HK97 family phage major capsid protein
MGRYLDALSAQFDEITEGIEETLNRAADEGREVTKDEAALVERDQARAEELKKAIEHYSDIEVTRSKVAEVRSKVPAGPRQSTTTVVVEREKDPDKELLDAFPTVGDYMVTIARALRGDREAGELIERATAHQLLADNPGIVPRPIIGPVINDANNGRPFISSISQKRLTAGTFDRPVITQHVAVGKQAAEKTLTESQKLLIGKLPAVAATYAGHLNISRQDVKWTQPGILQIVAEDFAYIYAQETDEDAVDQFAATITNVPIMVATFDAATVSAALFKAASNSLIGKGPLPDTLWVSADVWGDFGSLVGSNGQLVFPSMTPTSTTGNPFGLKLVVDPNFASNTAIVGPARFLEWYEDIDGFMSVQEPDVLGQLVGYAGYGAFINTKPTLFTPLALPAALAAASTAKK